MRGWIVGRIAMLVGAVGLAGHAKAQDYDSSAFSTEAQAERYLRENPVGPRAKAALLAIVEFQLARENPGFSRSAIAEGIVLPGAAQVSTGTRVAGTSRDEERDRDGDRDRDGGRDIY